MPIEYQSIKIPDLGFGIDTESPENKIAPGYSEDLENADPKTGGQLDKRKGYQGYGGNLPVRVKTVEQSGTDLCFLLDASIDLSEITSTPIIVKGKVSNSTGGDFPDNTTSINYYPNFTNDIRKTFTSTNTPIVIPETEHNIPPTVLFWTGAAASTSLVNNSNSQFFLDSSVITKSTNDLTANYTNNTGSNFSGFIFLKPVPLTAGSIYNSSPVTISTGTTSHTITSGTTAFINRNILAKVFVDTGTQWIEIVPDDVQIDDATGNVTITLTNDTGSSFSVIFSLVSAPTANFKTGNIGTQGTVTVDIDITGESSFAFIGCYLKDPLSTNVDMVIPDSIICDTANNVIHVTFVNQANTGRIFRVFWDFAAIVTNKLCVTATNSATITDFAPELTIWGLDHNMLYGSMRIAREGWVTHIDAYRSTGESRLVAGLGGNLFTNQFRDENSNDIVNLMPFLYPNINASTSISTILGPAFYDTGETPARTRGFITGDTGGSHNFTVSSVTYDSGNTWTKYILDVPSMLIAGTLSTIVSTTSGMEDILTVEQCSWAVHNGQFKIKQITTGVNQLNIWVLNIAIDSSDFDETGIAGLAGIFTDYLTFSGSNIPPFLPNDILLSGLFSLTDDFTVLNSELLSGIPTTLISNVLTTTPLPAGLRITAQRTSSIIPLRDIGNAPSVLNLVKGDMLSYSEINRNLRIQYINPLSDITISSIVGDGTTATLTLASPTTDVLSVGNQVLIAGTSDYNGVQTITDILTETSFTITSSQTTTNTIGIVVGKTIQVDENLTFKDTETSLTSFEVVSRWIPIEFPEDTYSLTPKTRISYFASNPYSQQAIIRSSMVQDNMYLTNGDDEVFKFDGENLYRAGLFRWQPNLFLVTDTTATGKITIDNPQVAYTVISQNKFTIGSGDEGIFKVGDIIQDSLDNSIYTIQSISNDGASPPINSFIFVDRTVSASFSGTPHLKRISTFKYYFRLNAVDANNNLIASAVTGADDNVIQLGNDAAVKIRLVGMPAWDIYDYNRLEVQIYRTKSNSVAPFYRLTTLKMAFNSTDGYIDYIDTDADVNLNDLDEINTALKGQELGTTFTEPMRAKYVTSAGNSLVLANLKDYPQLDIQIIKNTSAINQTVFTESTNRDWLFRKDSNSTQTTPDIINVAAYRFLEDSSSNTIASITNNSGISFTVTKASHGLIAGNWVYLLRDTVSTAPSLTYAGWWQIASATTNTFTVNYTHSASYVPDTTKDSNVYVGNSTGIIPVFLGQDYNWGMLNGNRDATETYEFLAMRRLASAINSSMRKTDITISGYETFKPWMIASAGNEFNSGQLIVRQPKAGTLTFGVQLPALSGEFDAYVNTIKRVGSIFASAVTKTYPSRLIISYPNFPEIFDNPTASLDSDSFSAVDVNSADGQEITAVIPFFGASAFGAALQSSVVVVFKTNSVYLVDTSLKGQGQPALHKLETRGKGCTAPYSVSATRLGIIFADETGIYRLGTDMQISFVGRRYERKWKENINKNSLDIATGTHDTFENAYKLSYPVNSDTENSLVAVYNHTREEVGQTAMSPYAYGSWTTYTNHPATGWTNLQADSYFGSTTGRVFTTRKLGEVSDYRDDSSPVSMVALIGATDFGDSGKMKLIKFVTTHFRVTASSFNTTLSAAADLNDSFDLTDSFNINSLNGSNGLSDTGTNKIVTIQSSIPKKRLVYMQVKYENSTIDEPVSIAGLDYTVGLLTEKGIQQAARTK